MSPISIPGKVRLEYSSIGFDSDAATYIAAVEAADGQPLEYAVTTAIQSFVIGCKADGIWNAIKASCILAGARTLSGALVPLKGTAPTNYNFVSGDYNRETGLVGDGSTKYLDSNRNNNADPQDSNHNAVWVSTAPSINGHYLSSGVSSGSNSIFSNQTDLTVRSRPATSTATTFTQTGQSTGFVGHSRADSQTFVFRAANLSSSNGSTSTSPTSGNLFVFSRDSGSNPTNARSSFYSIGESLDLALLDSRVSTLMTAIGAAIP